jgi:hypothetical protein
MLGIIAEGKGGRRRILHRSEELIWRMEALPECFGVWKFHEFPGLLDYQPDAPGTIAHGHMSSKIY